MSDVIQMAAFRKPVNTAAAQTRPTSRLHVDIMNDGSIDFPPVDIAQRQALAMLRICLAVSVHCLDRYNDQGGLND